MSLALYMDVHIDSAITDGLRLRGVDVLRAQDDGADQYPDPALLDRATSLGRVLFSNDQDFLREGARRQRAGESFSGVIYAHPLHVTIGRCIDDLEILAKLTEPHEVANSLVYIPL